MLNPCLKEDLNKEDTYLKWMHMEVVATMKHVKSWGRKRGDGLPKLLFRKKEVIR